MICFFETAMFITIAPNITIRAIVHVFIYSMYTLHYQLREAKINALNQTLSGTHVFPNIENRMFHQDRPQIYYI